MMQASLRDQLETFRSRAGVAPPSTHEVLHIDLELAGSDAEHALRVARHQALRWVSRRVGTLPKPAWEFDTFEHLPGGSAAYAVRLRTSDFDYWIARCDDPDKDVPGRTWTTEVSVVGYGGAGRFALRQQVASREHRPVFVPAVPGVVQQLVQAPGLHRLGRPVAVLPWPVNDHEAADGLITLIEDPRRRRPVIVVSLGEGQSEPGAAAVDAGELAKRLLGLAHVAVVSGPLTFRLTDRWSRLYSCFHRAVRVYLPKFDPEEQSPYQHPLFLPHHMDTWRHDTKEGFIDHLVRLAAAESLKRIRYDQDLPSFSKVKQAALHLERRRAADAGTSDANLLKLAEEEIEEQKREIEQLYGALAEEEERTKAASEEAQQATSQWHWLKERISLLEAELDALGRHVDAEVTIPSSLANVKDWADRHLAGRLHVTPKAARAAKDSVFAEPELAYRALLLMAHEYRLMRIEGGENRQKGFDTGLQELSLYNERSGDETRLRERGDEFIVAWDGHKQLLDWHLKNGGNTRDPTRCFRLYYFWDEAKQIVVVGSLPHHLNTRLT